MELYARTHPQEVTGVVLLDPNSSRYPQRCKAAMLDFCAPPSDVPRWASLFLPQAVTGEIQGFSTTHAQINAISHFPDVPLVVISANKSRASDTPKALQAKRLYTQMHREMAQLTSKAKFIICNTCGHYIHQDNPDLVVDAIKWVVEQR